MATQHTAPTAPGGVDPPATDPADTTTTTAAPDDDDAPASPPLPARHTAATPGPRAARLLELYASSLQKTLARVSWDNFASCYPTVATAAPGALRTVQRAMVERLEQLCNVSCCSLLPRGRTGEPRSRQGEGDGRLVKGNER